VRRHDWVPFSGYEQLSEASKVLLTRFFGGMLDASQRPNTSAEDDLQAALAHVGGSEALKEVFTVRQRIVCS
jgi:hypothetical protein